MVRIKIPRYDRCIDIHPCLYVLRGDVVCMSSETAQLTPELISTRSVSLVVEPTPGTYMRCPSWVDEYHRDTCESRFVFDERSQLSERPRGLTATLCLSKPFASRTDVSQIFETNRSMAVFGFSHNSLGDAVVDISDESTLSSREPLEMSFGTPRILLLERRTEFGHLPPDGIDLLASVDFSIAICSEVDNSQVHTQSTDWLEFGWFWCFGDNSKVEHTLSEDKVGLTSQSIKPCSLVFSDANGYYLPALESQHGYCFEFSERENTLVIDHRSIL